MPDFIPGGIRCVCMFVYRGVFIFEVMDRQINTDAKKKSADLFLDCGRQEQQRRDNTGRPFVFFHIPKKSCPTTKQGCALLALPGCFAFTAHMTGTLPIGERHVALLCPWTVDMSPSSFFFFVHLPPLSSFFSCSTIHPKAD